MSFISPVLEQHAAAAASVRGSAALARLMGYADVKRVLDIGSGRGEHAAILRAAGREVFTVDLAPPADHVGDFIVWREGDGTFDAVWVSHVLEHQPDVGRFLDAVTRKLRPGGVLAVTVPPMKDAIVGGHVSLWNAGLLLYRLILAGFDSRDARVGTYASGPGYPVYNISVIVRKPLAPISLPPLRMDSGDIDALAPFFPLPVAQGFDGRLPDLNW